MSGSHTLVVGIGSPHGDDQAGWLLAEQLAERLSALVENDQVRVRKAKAPLELLHWLEGVERLVLTDACRGLGPVGQWRRWSWPARELAEARWSGTHDVALPAVLELAERLGRLPEEVCIWSLEGAASDAFSALSPAVAAALPGMAGQVAEEILGELEIPAQP